MNKLLVVLATGLVATAMLATAVGARPADARRAGEAAAQHARQGEPPPPKIVGLETKSITQALSTSLLRLSVSVLAQPGMVLATSSGILLGKRWFSLGMAATRISKTRGRVRAQVAVRLTPAGMRLLHGRLHARLRFLVWCADDPQAVSKLVVTIPR